MKNLNGKEKRTAKVMAVHRERYELRFGEENLYARLKKADFYDVEGVVDFPTVGDEVGIIKNPSGDSLIVEISPRKSVFSRLNPTPGMPDLAVAANFDFVFLTMSLNRDFHLSKLERYVTAAWQSGGTPVILLTKVDLCSNPEEYLSQVERVAPGVAVHCISSVTGEGIAGLATYLATGKTVVLLGASGVGKSSLINLLLGKEQMKTGAIREADSQGRHTTTYKQCMFLPEKITLPDGNVVSGGGCIIDTPGIRTLAAAGETEVGVQELFAEVEVLAGKCRFADCRHRAEPGCAVLEAIAEGKLSERRFRSWLTLQREEHFAQAKHASVQRRFEKNARKRKESGRRKKYEF
ncbi:MAG: ribosome small subunit-dependent GTPase A [Lachnospiraceae bacterium]|nr:ribosome small subunit-dependent GTPase A [Lachnospiraceae bacterium]